MIQQAWQVGLVVFLTYCDAHTHTLILSFSPLPLSCTCFFLSISQTISFFSSQSLFFCYYSHSKHTFTIIRFGFHFFSISIDLFCRYIAKFFFFANIDFFLIIRFRFHYLCISITFFGHNIAKFFFIVRNSPKTINCEPGNTDGGKINVGKKSMAKTRLVR